MRYLSFKAFLFLILACFCIVLSWVILKKYRDVAPRVPEATYSISRQIRYGFTIQNKTNRLLKHAEFWTYGPVKQTPTQRCVRLEASHPYKLIFDDLGNQILHFTFNDLPPYATKIITIKADLELSDTPNPISLQDPQRFLRAEKYIESDDPELSRLAKKFKAPKPVKTAENIFRWVADNVRYAGYLPNDRGALYALRKKKGDCTEFMYLFAALCRANNIPARGIGGYVSNENAVLKPNGYHNWVEFYYDGAWWLSDPQKKIFMQNPSRYIAMRVIGKSENSPIGRFHRFRFVGDGLEIKMN